MKIEVPLTWSQEMIDGVEANINRYKTLGLIVHLTRVEVRCEYEVVGSTDVCTSWGPEEEKKQADVYEKLFKICLDASNCELFEFKDAAEKW